MAIAAATDFIQPQWPAPPDVHCLFTRRTGRFSQPPWASLNLGSHVGDRAEHVARNRAALPLPGQPFWLNQTHSTHCIDVDGIDVDSLKLDSLKLDGMDAEDIDATVPDVSSAVSSLEADASFTRARGKVLAVMVADCLPVLFAGDGIVGVAHAGWRGLADGILPATVEAMQATDLIAWLGPAIGACHYEVGAEVRQRFLTDTGFTQSANEKYMMDLVAIATEQLTALGVQVINGSRCTYCSQTDCSETECSETDCSETEFFSFRRDGVTGRMGGLIWRR